MVMLAARASTPAARQLTVERLQSCGGACHEPVIALMQARGPPILAKRAQRHDMTGADKPPSPDTTSALHDCFDVTLSQHLFSGLNTYFGDVKTQTLA